MESIVNQFAQMLQAFGSSLKDNSPEISNIKAAIDAALKTLAPAEQPQPPTEKVLLGVLADKLGYTTVSVGNLIRQGRLPAEKEGKCYLLDKTLVDRLDDQRDLHRLFELEQGLSRSTDDKARAVAIRWANDPLVQRELPRDFYFGINAAAMSSRLSKARSEGTLTTYNLRGVEMVNLDELKNFSYWFLEFFHSRNKLDLHFGGRQDFHQFCVHENDLVWMHTNRFQDRTKANPEIAAELADKYGKLSTVIRGQRYYTKAALEQVVA